MSVSSVQLSGQITPHVWTEAEVDARLTSKVIEVMQDITRINQTNPNPDVGIHYPLPYVEALRGSQDPKLQARLKTFIDHGMSYHGYASPAYFKMVADEASPSGKQALTFVIKPGVLPSEALAALRNGLSILGCGETCQVAQYSAILDVLGPEKFDALFAADSPTPLIISGTHAKNPISRLRNYMCKQDTTLEDVRLGDIVYFPNAKSYQDKHQMGASQGYNSVCMHEAGGASKFIGLGWPTDGLNYKTLQEVMRGKYNADPVNVRRVLLDKIWKKLPKQRLGLAQRQISHDVFKKEGGGTVNLICQLNAQRITAIANSTLEEARRLLDNYPVEVTGKRIVLSTPEEGKTAPSPTSTPRSRASRSQSRRVIQEASSRGK